MNCMYTVIKFCHDAVLLFLFSKWKSPSALIWDINNSRTFDAILTTIIDRTSDGEKKEEIWLNPVIKAPIPSES